LERSKQLISKAGAKKWSIAKWAYLLAHWGEGGDLVGLLQRNKKLWNNIKDLSGGCGLCELFRGRDWMSRGGKCSGCPILSELDSCFDDDSHFVKAWRYHDRVAAIKILSCIKAWDIGESLEKKDPKYVPSSSYLRDNPSYTVGETYRWEGQYCLGIHTGDIVLLHKVSVAWADVSITNKPCEIITIPAPRLLGCRRAVYPTRGTKVHLKNDADKILREFSNKHLTWMDNNGTFENAWIEELIAHRTVTVVDVLYKKIQDYLIVKESDNMIPFCAIDEWLLPMPKEILGEILDSKDVFPAKAVDNIIKTRLASYYRDTSNHVYYDWENARYKSYNSRQFEGLLYRWEGYIDHTYFIKGDILQVAHVHSNSIVVRRLREKGDEPEFLIEGELFKSLRTCIYPSKGTIAHIRKDAPHMYQRFIEKLRSKLPHKAPNDDVMCTRKGRTICSLEKVTILNSLRVDGEDYLEVEETLHRIPYCLVEEWILPDPYMPKKDY
jgi:hypothetical protein